MYLNYLDRSKLHYLKLNSNEQFGKRSQILIKLRNKTFMEKNSIIFMIEKKLNDGKSFSLRIRQKSSNMNSFQMK